MSRDRDEGTGKDARKNEGDSIKLRLVTLLARSLRTPDIRIGGIPITEQSDCRDAAISRAGETMTPGWLVSLVRVEPSETQLRANPSSGFVDPALKRT